MKQHTLEEGFVVLKERVPSLLIDLKYCGADNIIGRPLEGYAPDGDAVLTLEAADSLAKIAAHIQQPGIKKQLGLCEPKVLILEAYRPQMASDDFVQWCQSDCQKTKADYYPNIDKNDFLKLGYLAAKSSHTRGSTVDVTLVESVNGQCLAMDMGTRFDFMDVLSHPDNKTLHERAYNNRQFLKKLMADFGWLGVAEEWWHFTFEDEPFPDTYFNFPVINYRN